VHERGQVGDENRHPDQRRPKPTGDATCYFEGGHALEYKWGLMPLRYPRGLGGTVP
jgi:hypothetical protein